MSMLPANAHRHLEAKPSAFIVRRMNHGLDHVMVNDTLCRVQAGMALAPVGGDMLPPIGERVLIHVATENAWITHMVVGYYVWPWGKENMENNLWRVFVRVVSDKGHENARELQAIRRINK